MKENLVFEIKDRKLILHNLLPFEFECSDFTILKEEQSSFQETRLEIPLDSLSKMEFHTLNYDLEILKQLCSQNLKCDITLDYNTGLSMQKAAQFSQIISSFQTCKSLRVMIFSGVNFKVMNMETEEVLKCLFSKPI